MKGKGICTLGFILWVVIFCTIASVYVERQMTNPVVSVAPVLRDENTSDGVVPLDVLTEYETEMTVFEMRNDKEGWKTGLRAWPVESGYMVGEEEVTIIGALSEPYILRYAARPVFPGQLVEVSTQLETGNYSYLLIKENGETELFTMDGARPFMSRQTKSLLEIPQESNLYCLEEVCDFCKTFPLAAGIGAVLCSVVLLWIYCLSHWKNIRVCRKKMAVNAGLGVGLLAIAWMILGNINFPPSMLPEKNILELGHYKREIGEILEAIKPLFHEAALEVMRVFQQNIWISAGVFLAGVLTFLLLMIKFNKLASLKLK